MRGSRTVAAGVVVVGLVVLAISACSGPAESASWPSAPVRPSASSAGPATSAVVSPRGFHTPESEARWQVGQTLALPCAIDQAASARSLLRAGALRQKITGYQRPVLDLVSAGRLDLTDGVLGVSGSEWIVGDAHLDYPGELTYIQVRKSQPPVTVAWIEDAAVDSRVRAADFAAAEVRLSDERPVRWVRRGWMGTDVGEGAWFGSAARARLEATGYDPLTQVDGQGRSVVDAAVDWNVHCYWLDVAPRDVDQAHDVVVIELAADGAMPQYVGYDRSGQVAAAVILGFVPWAALGLPGTPPPGVQ